ncbi:MAG: hypothetical protein AB7L66_21475 [Gemmatimonadales bacterium]
MPASFRLPGLLLLLGVAGQPIYLAPALSTSAERPPFGWAGGGQLLPDTLLSRLRRERLIAGACTPAAARACAEAASGVRIRFPVLRPASRDEARLVAQVEPFWEPGSIVAGRPASVLLGMTAQRFTVAPVGQLGRELTWVVGDAIVLP